MHGGIAPPPALARAAVPHTARILHTARGPRSLPPPSPPQAQRSACPPAASPSRVPRLGLPDLRSCVPDLNHRPCPAHRPHPAHHPRKLSPADVRLWRSRRCTAVSLLHQPSLVPRCRRPPASHTPPEETEPRGCSLMARQTMHGGIAPPPALARATVPGTARVPHTTRGN
ncbi:hypothetical protein LshimejAT787_1600200 [Lyophyllum shimeji]|uniref:Uncharacterized protein n=1 Tax=Lyophyllum shimeji TaxID=47721 RepID=A0A9P3PXY9_LYOSH|nr:hypothetical protein LshimejAT787_1600200 [Lyophyllum shimeji]